MADSGPAWGKFLNSGFEVAAAIGVCCAAGYFIDRHFGTSPWFTVGGTILGAAAGMYLVIKATMQMNKD